MRTMKRIAGWLGLIGLLVGPAAGAAPVRTEAEAPLRPVTVLLQWEPQAQFAGYYLAEASGAFARRGIQVKFRHKLPGESGTGLLCGHEVEFVTAPLLNVLETDGGRNHFVNLFQGIQHSAFALVARRESGIEKVRDLNGRSISLWANDYDFLPRLLLAQFQAKARIVPIAGGVELFLRGAVDAAAVMLYNEYYSLLAAGMEPEELVILKLAEQGFDLPEDALFCHRELWERDPALCRAMAAAVREGWMRAFADRDEALRLVKQRCREGRVNFAPAHQRWMLDQLAELYQPDRGEIFGELSPGDFQSAVRKLRESGRLEREPRYEDFVPADSEGEKAP